ncbi:MAG: AmmeMemoRadiSam system radical SAM enzyme [Planctomycetota bacterium]
MYEARFYETMDESTVRCTLCPHGCRIADGKRGICRTRQCRGGKLYAATYGELASANMDPIEKKPLYHFHPGRDILSIGSYGCNFRCPWCQNFSISQDRVPTQHFDPGQVVDLARQRGSVGIAYTYNEPLIWAEFVIDTAKLAREAGLVNVLVTNGFVNPGPLAEMLPFIDAANLDIKAIRDEIYRRHCGGPIKPVLETARAFVENIHLEVTNLVITGVNDSDEDLAALAAWIADNLGRTVPTHLSRYFPQYRFDAPPTSAERLSRGREIFTARLDYVYLGNVTGVGGNDTLCRECGAVLVRRRGYDVRVERLRGALCGVCGAENNFVI